MSTEEWEAAIINKIQSLKDDYRYILNLSYRVKSHSISTEEDNKAVETALIIILSEIQRLEGDLIVHKLLKGENK